MSQINVKLNNLQAQISSLAATSLTNPLSSNLNVNNLNITNVNTLTTTNLAATQLSSNLNANTRNITNIGLLDSTLLTSKSATVNNITATSPTVYSVTSITGSGGSNSYLLLTGPNLPFSTGDFITITGTVCNGNYTVGTVNPPYSFYTTSNSYGNFGPTPGGSVYLSNIGIINSFQSNTNTITFSDNSSQSTANDLYITGSTSNTAYPVALLGSNTTGRTNTYTDGAGYINYNPSTNLLQISNNGKITLNGTTSVLTVNGTGNAISIPNGTISTVNLTFSGTINTISAATFSNIMSILSQNNTWTGYNAHNNYIQMSAGNAIYFNNSTNTQSMRIFSDASTTLQIANQSGTNVVSISQAGLLTINSISSTASNLTYNVPTSYKHNFNINSANTGYFDNTGLVIPTGYTVTSEHFIGNSYEYSTTTLADMTYYAPPSYKHSFKIGKVNEYASISASGLTVNAINVSTPSTNIKTTNTAGSNNAMFIGYDSSVYNTGTINFNYVTYGSSSNSLGFGLYGNDNIVKIQGDGSTIVNGTLNTSDYTKCSGGIWIPKSGSNSFWITDAYGDIATGTPATTLGRYFGTGGVIYQDFYNSFTWRGTTTLNEANVLTKMSLTAAGNLNLNVLGTGLIYSNGGTLTNTNPSDATLKENVIPISTTLHSLSQLNPVTYHWMDKEKHGFSKEYGLIAQEVLPIFPDLIQEYNDDIRDYSIKEMGSQYKVIGFEKKLGIDYIKLIPILISSIKELKAEVDSLLTNVKALCAKDNLPYL